MKFFVVIFFCIALPLNLFANVQDDEIDMVDSVEYDYNELITLDQKSTARVAPIDTTLIDVRSISDGTMEGLRKDSDLRYKAPPTIAENLFDRFLMWLGRLINKFFNFSVDTPSGRFIIYVITAIVVGLIIFFILKSTAFRVFLANKRVAPDGVEYEDENIHEMDFEALMNQALHAKDYRRGIRLIFLSALKMLSDRELIQWEQGKTNHEYMSELKQAELVEGFHQMNYYFDYAWYGDFNVTEDTFNRVQSIFSIWKTKLK